MITVLTPARDKLLTTVRAVKANLDLSQDTADPDELLLNTIREVSDWISNYCNRAFQLEEVEELVAGDNLPDMLLSRTPLVEVTEVALLGLTATDAVQLITDYDIFDREAGIIQRRLGFTTTNLSNNTISFAPSNYAQKRWRITYSGGYELPNWRDGDRNLPYDLERAAIEIVKTFYLNRKFDTSITSYKIGDTSVSWRAGAGELSGIPERAQNILNYYRRAV